MRVSKGYLCVCLLGTVSVLPAQVAPRFFRTGDLPGGYDQTYVTAMSADGSTLVGYSSSEKGREAFRWRYGVDLQALGDLEGGSFNSRALGVSEAGSIVVGYGTAANGGKRAFRWIDGGAMLDLGIRSGGNYYSEAYAVSASGNEVAGSSGDNMVRWTGATPVLEDLLDPPGGLRGGYAQAISGDGKVIVGYGSGPNGTEAFLWTQEGGYQMLGDLPGGSFSSKAYGVSYDGKTVVGESVSSRGTEAFRWTAETGMVNLGKLVTGGTYTSRAMGVSGDGSLVVGLSDIGGRLKVVVWDADGEVYDIEARLKEQSAATGWTLIQGVAISKDGDTIAGTGWNPNGSAEGYQVVRVRELIGLPMPANDPWWATATLDPSGWAKSAWFGWWWATQDAWRQHVEHGWIYAGTGDESTGLYFYDAGLRSWIWTQKGMYPWIYVSQPTPQWLRYFAGGTPGARWFYSGSQGWVFEPNL